MYSRICNPKTGRWVNLNGPLGKKILNNYFITQTGGANGEISTTNTIKKNCVTAFSNGDKDFMWNCPLDNEPQRTELEEVSSCDNLLCNTTAFELENDNVPSGDGEIEANNIGRGERGPHDTDEVRDRLAALVHVDRTTWLYEGLSCVDTFREGFEDRSIHFRHGDIVHTYHLAYKKKNTMVAMAFGHLESGLIMAYNPRLDEVGLIDEMYLQYQQPNQNE